MDDAKPVAPAPASDRQLTLRALLLGLLIAVPLGAANLYMSLKVGWSFGISILAAVLAGGVSGAVRQLGGGEGLRLLEANIVQTTASAAGYATGGAMAIALAAALLAGGAPLPLLQVIAFVAGPALLGVLFTIPLKPRLVDREELPFPDGRATAELLRGIYSRSADAARQTRMLLGGLIFGGVVTLARLPQTLLSSIPDTSKWYAALQELAGIIRLPATLALPYRSIFFPTFRPQLLVTYEIDPSLASFGAGLLIGPRIAWSMLLGFFLLYWVFGPWAALTDAAAAVPPDYILPTDIYIFLKWSVWGGVALLTTASLTSLAISFGARGADSADRAGSPQATDARETRVPTAWLWIGLAIIGPLLVLNATLGGTKLPFWPTLLLIVLAFPAAVMAGRVVGETNNNPVGSIGKLGQLALALAAPRNMAANLLGAGAAAGAAQSAADMMQDLKAGRLLGASARRQFIAQGVGCLGGAVLIALLFQQLFPNAAAVEEFGSPLVAIWLGFGRVCSEGIAVIPPSAQVAALAGAALGVLLPLAEWMLPGGRRWIPSAMGLAFAWVMPASVALPIALGGLAAGGWSLLAKRSCERVLVPIASGLIAGAALVEVLGLLLAAWWNARAA